MATRLLVGVIAMSGLAACTDNPPTVSVHAANAALLAVRIEDGAWRTLTPAADGTATFDATGAYAVASVCTGDHPSVQVALAGPADDRELDLACSPAAGEPLAQVTLEHGGAGRFDMYVGGGTGSGRNSTSGDQFALVPGTYDLVFVDRTTDLAPRFQLQRGVQLAAGPTTITYVPQGDMIRRPVTTTDPFDFTPSALLFTRGGTAVQTASGAADGQGLFFPPSALEPDDLEFVAARVTGNLSTTGVPVPAGDGAIVFPSPAAISDATRTAGAHPLVSWTAADPGWFARGVRIVGAVPWSVYQYAGATGFDRSSLQVPDLSGISGWNPAWEPAATAPYTVNLWRQDRAGYADLYFQLP